MTSLKRKASQELTHNSIEVIEPIHGDEMFETILGWFWGAVEWFCRRVDPLYTDMSYSNIDVVADEHIQRAEAREDGSTAVKRQRNKSRSDKHRRTSSCQRRTPSINMDKSKSLSEEELRAETDAQWIPPAFGAPTKPVEREVIVISDDDEGENEEERPKSIADTLRTPRSRKAPSIRLQSMRDLRRSSTATVTVDNSLNDRLATILTFGDDEQDDKSGPSPLAISTRAQEKHKKEREAQELKQKQEKIRIAKERRLTRRDPSNRLVHALDDKWEDIVREALDRARKNGNLPITQSQGGTPLHYKDFGTLLGRNSWLNDEIINTYIEWVVEAANEFAKEEAKDFGEPVGKVPKFIAHNSFFYENLDKKGPSSTQRLMGRKKAPGVSLLQVDTVFVPICRGSHWTVGVVRPMARTIEYFDSLQGSPKTFIKLMRGWLKFQLGADYKEDEWKTPNTGCTRQMNGYDCGVFVCTNALCVALGINTDCYNGTDMTTMRRNIAALLINKGFQGDFAWGRGVF
ncbi:hypothetical protein BOTNAR_0129g00160 [Botryotinia narcissicola]|uniref:Ubiquitin-like protease family profile domain-containing protein n=1 Tax=Botryotinia narcissicola TaxID=278944 RepID=A0A4Z1IJ22_9HELO|nr:hypothetical protein BOTNAR_0129g00160 [Botryotinia narcissicola]